jgi:ribose transport system substrate-binding protein
MKKFKFVVSLTNDDNDYQMEQASSAEEAARRLGVDLQIICADNDAIVQSQQLLKIIQSSSTAHPDGIIFEPVGGTGLPQVARAAAIAGIGWVVLNRDVDYINDLRKAYRVPMFAITSNHEEIGRIEGRQFGALLPKGGNVLYVTGPSESLAAKQRTAGMYETKPADVQVKLIKANWTEASAHKAVTAWLKLSTSQQTVVDLVASQDDGMAIGARKGFQELPDETLRNRWLAVPYIGCDGMPKTGQAWVKRGLLAATIINPANTGKALDMLIHALQVGTMPPDRTMTIPLSFPALDVLASAHAEKIRIMSAGSI